MYKNKVVNKFYEALFSTDFHDYETKTQNAKTDLLVQNSNISFEEWYNKLIEVFCDEFDEDFKTVKVAVIKDYDFIVDLKKEFEDLKDLI